MKKTKTVSNPKDFDSFLERHGYDKTRIKYLGKDCYDYRVRDTITGKKFFIRY